MKELLTAKEVSQIVKLHEKSVYRLASEGKLPSIRVANSLRFDPDQLAKYFRREEVKDEK